jgi:hypothetical protein
MSVFLKIDYNLVLDPKEELWKCSNKTLEDVELWSSSFSKLELTSDQMKRVIDKLDVFERKVVNLFENRRRELRGSSFQIPDSEQNVVADGLEMDTQKNTGSPLNLFHKSGKPLPSCRKNYQITRIEEYLKKDMS